MATSIILILIGLAFIGIAINTFLEFKRISKTGIQTEGIIFDTKNTDTQNSTITYPVIRFLTTKNEWITEAYKIGLIPGLYKKGARVTIIYIPDNPHKFFIKSTYSYLVPAILSIVAMLLITFGALNLFNTYS